MEKMVYKNVKRNADMEGLSAAISVAWDRLAKKIINNSINQWRIRLEKLTLNICHTLF